MATSAIPGTIAYLVSIFTAASTLGAASPAVAVRCGPALTADFNPLTLWVAIDDPYATATGGIPRGATSTQEWAGMPARLRNEDFVIDCCAEAWSGDTNTVTAMTNAYAITAAVEDVLRADVGLGNLVLFQDPGFTNTELRWHQGDGGAAAQVLFQITAKARIGG